MLGKTAPTVLQLPTVACVCSKRACLQGDHACLAMLSHSPAALVTYTCIAFQSLSSLIKSMQSTFACVSLAGTVCGGHTHAWREGDRCDCQGRGVAQKPKSGNHTSSRVENHLKDMKAITRLKGAAAMGTALFMMVERPFRNSALKAYKDHPKA